ncbi:unnamed protein product [Candidula unifasciata]|uniref:SCP domain-containing protein n=1 Tax=Candidula unifasciata TaxID=100452 RepID=A0A8S3ZLI1_9EUPU|nr:unnamed protein product [Candidula unifasciata]
MYYFAVVMVAFVACTTNGQSVNSTTKYQPVTTGNGTNNSTTQMPQELVQLILENHNAPRLREKQAALANLTWNSVLAAKAQAWTESCNFSHQPSVVRVWAAGANDTTVGRGKKYNHGGTFEECCSFQSSMCCHYTQIVWSKTTTVGCGYNVCANLTHGTGTLRNVAYLACYYYPPGNTPQVKYDWRPFQTLANTTSKYETATTKITKG